MLKLVTQTRHTMTILFFVNFRTPHGRQQHTTPAAAQTQTTHTHK